MAAAGARPAYQGCEPSEVKLRDYQTAVTAWILAHPEQRGLLVDYNTGTGKTLLASNAAEALRRAGRIDHVLVITPKSVVGNFINAINECTAHRRHTRSGAPAHYHVHGYDEFVRERPDRALARFMLIVDEAHNLRNAETQRAVAFIDASRRAEFTMLLTATPFVNHGSDISPLMRVFTPEATWAANWPLDAAEFDAKYANNLDLYVANMNRLVAFYQPTADTFPAVREHVRQVPMSPDQVRLINDIKAKTIGDSPALQAMLERSMREGKEPSDRRLNAFLTRTRQVSNGIAEAGVSNKVAAVVQVAIDGPKPAILYSQFKAHGVDMLREGLFERGVPLERIVVMTGDMTKKTRDTIVTAYNRGAIDYLLFTECACEGISLRGTRQIHLLEPFWNMTRMRQAKGCTPGCPTLRAS